MGERIEVSTARDDIRNLFDQQFPDGDNPYEAYGRLAAFLAQVAAREALLMEALKACQVCAEAMNIKEAARAKRLAKDVIGNYGVQGGMNARHPGEGGG